MAKEYPLYCTLYKIKFGNWFGLEVTTAEAHRYIFDSSRPRTMISQQTAVRLKATTRELNQKEMMIEIMLSADPVSFETKVIREEVPTIPRWCSLKVVIATNAEMRIFDLVIGSDAAFQAKANPECWQQQIEDYQKHKKMSEDIS